MPESEAQKAAQVRSRLTDKHRKNLYQAARFLSGETRDRIGLRVPCTIYVQDPSTGAVDKELGLQEVEVRWEPSLGDGPTSARLAVVDYDGDTGNLQLPARWNQKAFSFLTDDGKPVTEAPASPQFRQVNAWATVQRVLEYYEDLLGRPVPWGFEGNRLLIVPQAGFRDNAFYDRNSKSLQLYYFGDPQAPRYTCLSHDIITHETGHALLDGIRPHFLENSSWETAAFHEFIGDLTAILLTFRNNDVRAFLNKLVGIDVERAPFLAGVAEEFGIFVDNRPFLRSALDPINFGDAQQERSAHRCSQVLTGAMFDILIRYTHQYLSVERQAKRQATPAQALAWAADRIGRTALQPLDLLPPADVRFLDYARAVLRNDEITNPEDRQGYRKIIREVFHQRGLCPGSCDEDAGDCLLSLAKPPRLTVFYDLAEASRSRSAAYHLVHDNRELLGIPPERDFVIIDLYDCNRMRPGAERLPRQIIIEYLWREDVKLEEERFGRLQGETVHLLCGGTLVFDDRNNLRWWTAKHGRGNPEGEKRRAELLDHIASIVGNRRLTLADDSEGGMLTGHPAAVVARRVGGALRLETAPHLCGGVEEDEEWTTSF
ncbi:MAG: hypothetical protein QOH06_3968 [Acidobacteriota bacterium]|jgi:hypothetical protein|nr:hypothetical protein [Acidobacteriota bacterium]